MKQFLVKLYLPFELRITRVFFLGNRRLTQKKMLLLFTPNTYYNIASQLNLGQGKFHSTDWWLCEWKHNRMWVIWKYNFFLFCYLKTSNDLSLDLWWWNIIWYFWICF